MKTKQRFIDRIGKRVYRGKTTCTCPHCDTVYKEGLVIEDSMQAQYLYDVYCDCQTDYFDTREEIVTI